MQTETPNSIKPSNSSPGKPQRPFRRKLRARQPFRRPSEAGGNVQQVTTAGGIIFRRRGSGAEIFFIKDPFGKWAFPKGKANPNEPLADAAIRESFEEAGLTGLKAVAPLGHTTFRFRRQGQVIQKTVYFFLLEASLDSKEHFPTRETIAEGKEPIFEGKWVRTQTVFSVSSYKNSDRLLARALRIIAGQRSPQSRPAAPPTV